jgi:negative regulator of flagellin synthesis FlgM
MPLEIRPVHGLSPIRPRLAETAEGAPGRRQQVTPAPAHQGEDVAVDANLQPSTPPVESERVDQIRKALESGSYPIVPTRIADAMIAARFMLSTS